MPRTDPKEKRRVPERPREAHVEKTTLIKYYYVGTGGVQRGWQSVVEFCHPLWALCYFLTVEKVDFLFLTSCADRS